MPNSPTNCHTPPQNEQILDTQKRLCDFCSKSTALVYCRADNAKLCLSCDREVHSTNQLFTKHTRFQLCDSCDSSPASILCFTEQSVLCQNCDYETHTCHGTSANHDRRPLEGFTGQPSVFELSAAIGFGDFDAKCCVSDEEKVNNDGFNGGLFGGLEDDNDGFSDFFAWDLPTNMVSIDELIDSTDKTHNFQAMVVPPLPKDRNLSCGQHKHEILRQLCELSKFEPGVLKDGNPIAGQQIISDEDEKDSRVRQKIRASHHDEEHPTFQENEANLYTWCNDGEGVNDVFISTSLLGNHIEESVLKSDSQSGMCSSGNLATSGWNTQYPISNDSPESFQKVPIRELISADRDSAISRYKEKKRNRRFEKHIRYESRKLQAENRTRIKGRFAKLDNRMNQA